MLVASPDVRVLAITTSDGVLDARSGYFKVRDLLADLHHEGILTGYHTDPRINIKSCPPALQMEWGMPLPKDTVLQDAVSIINEVLENHQENITFICLGSLNTVNLSLATCPEFSARIKRILWSSTPEYKTENFNYSLDIRSASSVLASKTPVNLINIGMKNQYDGDLIRSIAGIHNHYADKVNKSLLLKNSPYADAMFDEAVALYLHYPQLFIADTIDNAITYSMQGFSTANKIHDMYLSILAGETVSQNQVLAVFPMDTLFYFEDVRAALVPALEKYGKEEWIAGVMANEMHRHLGIYAIIGVKMGVRAKEYFGAGVDEMSVVSYAGLTPPFSCMNDGLQISTGATLGHGLIRVASDTLRLPVADFTYMNRTIRVSLIPEIRTRVEAEVRELSKIHGLDSDIYWELVRKKAITYWSNFDRQQVFTVDIL
jgi:formylmethanofuran dehydrogenase subunit E/inosine-uridine nucleoside N-ribohydrolase